MPILSSDLPPIDIEIEKHKVAKRCLGANISAVSLLYQVTASELFNALQFSVPSFALISRDIEYLAPASSRRRRQVYSDLSEAMSMEKRYFTSERTNRS